MLCFRQLFSSPLLLYFYVALTRPNPRWHTAEEEPESESGIDKENNAPVPIGQNIGLPELLKQFGVPRELFEQFGFLW